MNTDIVHENTHTYLTALEERIDELIAICEQLTLENQSLHTRQYALLEERDALSEQNEQIRARIDTIVARLKGLGQSYE